ncbi:uncharacterized protein N7496_005731 [Penicillium cataractarum]|uniref:Uncharacterized protein n=1 Tax=Penicillium cataractarum TaxID=2100454 RepID=A0A9W9SGQ9_9EURO|nr:uncharacterized protein N7496_005731 [Penicillium cataractarum]KAJ5378322.1 hypothetical protein N7496_005731 [Penicillium cataractarum]
MSPSLQFQNGLPCLADHTNGTDATSPRLRGKVTVVTGGAAGIGQDLAQSIAEAGGDVAILDIAEGSSCDLVKLANFFGVRAKYYRTDVSDKDKLEQTFNEVVRDFGHIDGCVTAAGVMVMTDFLDYKWDDAVTTQMINVVGTFMTAQLAAKQMRLQRSGGSIVMIASVAAHLSSPALPISAYTASKGAVKALSHALTVELGPMGIRVNTISPGYIRTSMTGKVTVENPELASRFSYEPPLGRMGETRDLTGAVNFLLCESSSYISGSDILITGGLHAGRYAKDREPHVSQ